jgi:uncharacterized protein YegP (UPF0339 family)
LYELELAAMYFALYRDDGNRWRWTLYSKDRRKIADSGESYGDRADALHAIFLVKGTSSATPVHER